MAINIKFDLAGNPEPPTIILANRNGNKLGQLAVDEGSIELKDKFNDASEFSFTLNKYIDGKLNNLWDKVVDFKLVYCKEWDMWFEITIELDESTETMKTVFCTQLGQAELSQIMLYNIEINTENDIARDDYKISILCDKSNKDSSILHRMLEKAPHYSIVYVDPTIRNIQRSFSFDDTSIYDAFQEIADEIGCFFDFPSNSGENGEIQRYIYVYDLYQNCNDCGHRGEFTDVCPKCGSKNIRYGYGEDTLIFATSDELASNGIQLTTDTDSAKNCFRLRAGDDLMTATIRNCNPNGTDYIWRFSEDMKSDMSNELVEKLKSYDNKYKYYYDEHISSVDSSLIGRYNVLIDKYKEINKALEKIPNEIRGHSALMNAYYSTVDLSLFLKSVLTPYETNIYFIDESNNFFTDEADNYFMHEEEKTGETSAKLEAGLLTSRELSPVSVANTGSVSLATLDSTMLSMAKIIVNPAYKIQIYASEMGTLDDGSKTWIGNFELISYYNEEDKAVSEKITVKVNDDYESFVKQKIKKMLSKENTDNISITTLFQKHYNDFCDDIKEYALDFLVIFRDACQSCIDILIEQGIGNNNAESWDSDLYNKLYVPYRNKLLAIEDEIKVRENEINLVLGEYNSDGILISDGMQSSLKKCKDKIQNELNFQTYLGNKLWLEFCSYRREAEYSNDNYISDGLNNAELFEKASEFFEVANNEIYKSSEFKRSISSTLNNLLAIPKFKTLVKSFKIGNWIRIRIDDKIYKLRLIEYTIDFGDFDNISVEFSDVTRVKNGITDVESILSKASSMASSYDYIQKQATQGEKNSAVLNSWIEDGLNAANTKIVGADNQNQVWDKNGILCRQYDPVTETYSDEQLKIVNSTIAITDDNWQSTKTAIGKYYYNDPITKELKSTYGVNGETIVGKLILGENMIMQNKSGGMVFNDDGLTIKSGTDDDVGTMIFNEDGLVVSHGKNTVTISPKTEEVMNITNGEEKVFNVSENGELSINGNIIARSLKLENGVTIDSGVITNLATVAVSGSYNNLIDTPTKLSDFENDGVFITKDADNLANYYKKTEIDNSLKLINDSLISKANVDDLSDVATSGSYKDLIDIDELKNWVLEQIQSAINQ